MQEKKKRNRILMLLIVGMLLIYAFTDIENVKINRERKIFFSSASQNVLKQAANWLLPGLTYVKEGRKDTLTGRIEKSVLSFVPISEYVRNHEEPETTVEDTLTRTMILENQANDENAIDENGNLIPAGSMQESVGAGVPEENAAVLASTPVQDIDMNQLNDYEYLVGTFYTVDGTTMTGPEELNAGKFLEKNLAQVSSVTKLLDEGRTPEQILEVLLGDMDLEIQDTIPTQYYCNCSKERVEKAIVSIGRKEINDMIQAGKPIEVKCHFCNTAYEFSIEDLKQIIKRSK